MKRIVAFVVLAVAAVALLVASRRRDEPSQVSGVVEADEIRVGSRVGGRVRLVHVTEGATVAAGDALVEFEPFDLLERRAQAAAEVAARRAEHERLRAGSRPEEIAQAKARREQIAARLERLVSGPRAQELAAAQARVAHAEADIELARKTHERVRGLLDRGAVSAEELDRAAQSLETSQQQLAVRREELALLQEGTRAEDLAEARAQLEEADQAWRLREKGSREEEIAAAKASLEAAEAAVASIDRQIEELVVRAPSEAVVDAVDLQPGDLVPPNAPVLSLVDVRRLRVRAYVPEARLALHVGDTVPVAVDAFPGETFRGRVTFVARQGEFAPRNVQTPEERSKQVFRIRVELEEGLDRLRPGMSADVGLTQR